MIYGDGFWVVRDGKRLHDRFCEGAYPKTVGFEYQDGTPDRGEFLVENFTIDYVPPGWTNGMALRMTIRGNPNPILHEETFDFDWASIPQILRGPLTCDKADHRIRVGALFHDMGYCVHEVLPFMTIGWWNELLEEAMEAYCEPRRYSKESLLAYSARRSRDTALRKEVRAGVAVGGPFCWKKSTEDVEYYRGLFHVEQVPL